MELEVEMKKLGENPVFKKLQSTFTNYSPFWFQSMTEPGVSKFVTWSLNPREAHNSLNFCREFMTAISDAIETNTSIKNKAEISEMVQGLKENPSLWNQAIFYTEYRFSDNTRCDILIAIPTDSKTIWIMVENKIKTGISKKEDSPSQLKKYRNNLKKDLGISDPILLFMDASDRGLMSSPQYQKEGEHWIEINYHWIGNAIQEQLTWPNRSEVDVCLRSIATELESFFSEELDPSIYYWSKAYEDIEFLGNELHEIWDHPEYEELRNKVNLKYLAKNKTLTDSEKLILENLEIFEELEEYSFMSHLESSDYELQVAPVNSYAYAGNLRTFECESGSGTTDYWAVCIWIKKMFKDDEGEKKFKLDLSFAPNKTNWDSYQKAVFSYFSEKEGNILPVNREIKKADLKQELTRVMNAFRAEAERFQLRHKDFKN